MRDFLRDAFGDAFGDAGGVGKCEQDGVPAIVMAIHTFGEYLDFHPHLHALVADGLFDREGKFHVMRAGELTGDLTQEQRGTTDAHLAGNHAALEQLFRARVIAFLVEAGLLPLDRARMLRGWVHSGFQVHQSRRIAANECQDIERLAQSVFCCEDVGESLGRLDSLSLGNEREDQAQLFYSRKYSRRCSARAISSRQIFITVTQHIPDKRFQMVRYYGWYSNKMRGQRRKREEETQAKAACESAATAQQGCGALASAAIEIIEHPALKPRRIPSQSWRELIKHDQT